jgi:hypothetical protein
MSNTELATVSEKSLEENHMRMGQLDDSLFSKELAPHYMKLAGQLASSEMVPKCFRGKPQDLFIAWSMGYQIGMPPEQAMQCIAVINGKASMWGDDMLALCMAHKDFEDIIEEPIMKDGNVFGYTCTVKRRGMEPKTNKFDLNDAKKAGLLGKAGPWTQYPERMLKLRARGFTLRDAFPDALKGIKPREEVEDYIDAEYTVSKPSRTAVLKNDIMSKQGVSDVDLVHGFAAGMEDKETEQETTIRHEDQSVEKVREEATELHSKIKQLIDETGFTEDRLKKALKFYQVESIDEMDWEAAHHFALQLTK